jgi:hypothetical protein
MPDPLILPSLAQVRQRAAQMGARLGTNLTRTTVTPNVDVNGKPEHEPETPIMEHPNERYNAYRGTEMHGVEPGNPWDGGPEGFTNGTVDVHWTHDDPDYGVVPVRVVADPDETLNRWRTAQHFANAVGLAPAQIIPQHRQRTRIRIVNLSTTDQTIWIIHSENENGSFNGFPIKPTDPPFELITHEAVYASSSDANPAPVAFVVEFVDRLLP